MKYLSTLAVLISLAVQIPLTVYADDDIKMGETNWAEKKEKHFENMKKKLNLTPTQESTVKGALEEKHKKMMALHDEIKTKTQAIREEYKTAVMAVLNEDQKKTFAEIQEKKDERMEKRKERRMEKREKMKSESK